MTTFGSIKVGDSFRYMTRKYQKTDPVGPEQGSPNALFRYPPKGEHTAKTFFPDDADVELA